MQPATVGAILDAVGKHWTVAPDVEVTLEANPTSVEATRFRGYRAAGVNRVSLGVQALDDASLKALGRLHTAREALDAVAIARAAFERYFVRPDLRAPRARRRDAWAAELKRAIAEAAEHLSLYQLTIEPDTPFHALHAAGKLVMPDDDTGARALRHHAGDLRPRRPSGLRDLQSRAAGRRVPPQPGLLARARIRRHRPGRAWPARHRRRPPRHRHREASGVLADARRVARPRRRHRRPADPRRARRRIPADGAAARRGHRSGALRRRSPAGRSIRSGSRSLPRRAWSRATADGCLRVTKAGFPVLDAVVADLAA